MFVGNINLVPLIEQWTDSEPEAIMKANFVPFEGQGPQSMSLVYMELPPNGAVASHEDSVEEMMLVLNGMVEASVAGQKVRLGPGGILAVPANVAHSLRNVGLTTARAVGFFPSASVSRVFEEPLQPSGERIFSAELAASMDGFLAGVPS